MREVREVDVTRRSLKALQEEMRAVAGGAGKPEALSAAPLLAALTRESFELLGILFKERVATVTQLTDLTGRAQPNISRSLQLLAQHRLIRLVRDGREVRAQPIARRVSVDLSSGTYEATPVEFE
jgi:predicted transcriptional regulator